MKIPEPNPESKTWPLVLRFAKLMEHKLEQNRHKGDADGWRAESVFNLGVRLDEERHELVNAMIQRGPDEIVLESCEVANFAMMIADKMIEESNRNEHT